MSLPTGARLGSYEIIGLPGAGGMGEQTASNVNHPNILTIEIGESGGTRFMTAELVQGETLRAKLGRGPIHLMEDPV